MKQILVVVFLRHILCICVLQFSKQSCPSTGLVQFFTAIQACRACLYRHNKCMALVQTISLLRTNWTNTEHTVLIAKHIKFVLMVGLEERSQGHLNKKNWEHVVMLYPHLTFCEKKSLTVQHADFSWACNVAIRILYSYMHVDKWKFWPAGVSGGKVGASPKLWLIN